MKKIFIFLAGIIFFSASWAYAADVPVAVEWTITSDWGSGHCASVEIENTRSKEISSWKMRVPERIDITSIWSARYKKRTFQPEDWTRSIPVGGNISFGYCANGSAQNIEKVRFGIHQLRFVIPVDFQGIENTGSVENNGDGGNTDTPSEAAALALPDASSYVSLDEIKIGTNVVLNVWGETDIFSVPEVGWGLALAHASKIAAMAGLDSHYGANEFFATAIKESRLGTSYGDGVFQIENGTAFEEMKRMYPGIFADLNHSDIIAGDAFETSAITKAYYDVFSMNMLDDHFAYNATGFVEDSVDEQSLVKIISLAYNRGLWWDEFPDFFETERQVCVSKENMLDCIEHDIAHDHATAIAEYANILNHAPDYGGSFYDPKVSWEDVDAYLIAMAPLNPGIDMDALRSRVSGIFDNLRNADGTVSFRYDVPKILDEIILNTWSISDPSSQINAWY